MNCPDCGILLNVRKVGLHALETCGACHGVWIDRVMAVSLSDSVRFGASYPPAVEKRVVSVRRCGRCAGAPMAIVRFRGHEVDVCTSCKGIWLDADEINPIIARLATRPGRGSLEPFDQAERRSTLVMLGDAGVYFPYEVLSGIGEAVMFGADVAAEAGAAIVEIIVGALASL